MRRAGPKVELSWPAGITNGNQSVVFPKFQVLSSRDFTNWAPVGATMQAVAGLAKPAMTLALDAQPGASFYRVSSAPTPPVLLHLGNGGSEVFGFDSYWANEVQQLGMLSAADFATNAPQPDYLTELTWDPRTAQFWTNFYSTNLHTMHYGPAAGGGTDLSYNFRLDDKELAVFMTNGFVVSERLGAPTFGDAYYRVFSADLPVFVTSDSILQAWHRTYQAMLEELEELQLATLMERVISNMSTKLPFAWVGCDGGALTNSVRDADYFLTVARSLWAGKRVPTILGNPAEETLVQKTLDAVANQSVETITIFGTSRSIDFSQFKVRGHYTASVRLGRYFKTMMWCGRTDLRLVTFEPNKEDDIRQLGTALVLQELLTLSGQSGNWKAVEQITRAFVGRTDSMTFAQLEDLRAAAGVTNLTGVTSLTLTNLQQKLLEGTLGIQNIHSDDVWSPFGPEQVRVARSFTVFGQKFVLDSWAFNQAVFDRILWDEERPGVLFGKVLRRKPSCLDVVFSVLGNDQVVPELLARIQAPDGVPFRDGLPYQHNLLAVRRTIDAQSPDVWSDNIYNGWLAALRALSSPTTGAQYPEVMRTRPWATKTLNTQLGSWTQLRHDTILYAKQSYTEQVLCSYPYGFVEPLPEFWSRMGELAQLTATAISSLPLSGTVQITNRSYFGPPHLVTFDLAQVKAAQVESLNSFAATMSQLRAIATMELAQQPLSVSETDFLKDIVERAIDYVGLRYWSGWYPALFYQNTLGGGSATPMAPCDQWDALVTDVHTDLPDQVSGDPGAIIHEGVGNVHMMLIAVDNGPDRMVYAGPVLSHYEFEKPVPVRLSDEEWKASVSGNQHPASPGWTESYLVPGPLFIPPGY